MHELSAGYSLPPFSEIERLELNRAFDISINNSSRFVPSEIISKDVGNIFWKKLVLEGLQLSDDEANDLNNFIFENSLSIAVESTRGLLDDLNSSEKQSVIDINRARLEYDDCNKKNDIKDKEQRKKAFLEIQFMSKFSTDIKNIFSERKITKSIIDKMFESFEKTWTFNKDVSTFYVECMLIFEFMKNPSLVVKEHDFSDIAFLQVAIPYSDVVILIFIILIMGIKMNLLFQLFRIIHIMQSY